jgi:L-lactate dehydrogenase complex protein LldG
VTEKEKILARIREALTLPAPIPGHAHANGRSVLPAGLLTHNSTPSRWLPEVGSAFEDRLALFRKNVADLKAEFHFVESADQAVGVLTNFRDAEGWKKVGTHGGPLTDPACEALGLPICRTDRAYEVTDLESCDAGISECDALVAQTGSVLVTGRSAGGRALSVLPPHHVVLARRQQLVGDLPEAFALLKRKYAGDFPSFISLITGPSRTGDIERILVLGAHGPKKLTIVCW